MKPEPVTAEWQRQADAEPFRIAYSIARRTWTVYDCRAAEDAPAVAGPFRSRDAAAARADKLNRSGA